MNAAKDFIIKQNIVKKYTGKEIVVNVPDGVTAIGADAFRGSAVTAVFLPPSVQIIAGNAFACCHELVQVELPAGLKEIGESAFCDCTGLMHFPIPAGVRRIGDGAFRGCSALRMIALPAALSMIEPQVFCECSSLSRVVIPDGVRIISDSAFYRCVRLQQVELPAHLEKIGRFAFTGCRALSRVYFKGRVEEIQSFAFYRCTSLERVVLPSGLTRLSEGLFRGCSLLKEVSIPLGVTRVEPGAFEDCRSLERADLPDGVEYLGRRAFFGCCSLTRVHFPEAVSTVEEDAFWGCNKLEDEQGFVVLGSILFAYHGPGGAVEIPKEVTAIAHHAFLSNDKMTSLVVHDGVETIARYAFAGCTALEWAKLPQGLTRLPPGIFDGCTALKQAPLPRALTELGDGAFQSCTGLTQVELPDGVTSIGDRAFRHCTGLTRVSLPDSVKRMGWEAFRECDALERLDCSPGFDLPMNKSALEEIYLLKGLKTGRDMEQQLRGRVKRRKQACFSRIIAENNGAAARRFLEVWEKPSLDMVDDCISRSARAGSAEVTAALLEFRKQTFSSAEIEQVQEERLDKDLGFRDKTLADWRRSFRIAVGGGRAVISGCRSQEDRIVVPAQVSRHRVVALEGAFAGCGRLTGVELPDSLERIGDFSFSHCSELTGLTIPNSVTYIGQRAFSYCRKLRQLTLPEGVTTIGDAAFRGCGQLQQINIPAGVTELGSSLFEDCPNLTRVEIAGEQCMLSGWTFGRALPAGLIPQVGVLWRHMNGPALRRYVVSDPVWDQLPALLQAEIFLQRQDDMPRPLRSAPGKNSRSEKLGEGLLEWLSRPCSNRECMATADFMVLNRENLPSFLLWRLYVAIKRQRNGAQAVRQIRGNRELEKQLRNMVGRL